MESQPSRHQLDFSGNATDLYGLFIKNMVLTVLTLFIYRPWAINANRKYFLSRTKLAGASFNWHGTGREMFWGYVKGLLLFGGLYLAYLGLVYWSTLNDQPTVLIAGTVVLWLILLALLPIAMIGTLRYRLSRTSWSNVRFSFQGTTGELTRIVITGTLLSIVTVGFYLPFFTVRLYRFYAGGARFGSAEFQFFGNGWDSFVIYCKAIFFGLLTLGIYLIWNWAENLRFMVNNTAINGRRFHIRITGGEAFKLLVPNALAVICSLGLALPWAVIRTTKFLAARITLDGSFLLSDVVQNQPVTLAGAAGEGVGEALDVDFGL